jgi:PAS domain S-box-containing protein
MSVPPTAPTATTSAKPDSGALLAAIVSSSDDAIVSKTLDGTITSWNQAAQRILGYTPEEIIGRSILTLIPPELHHEEPGIIAKIRAGERIEHYETVRLSKGGKRIDVSLTVSPIRDSSGHVIGASKVLRDVSGRIESERAKSVLAAIVQSSDDAIISKDLEGNVTSWNPAAERLYGFAAEEMIGRSILKVIPPHLKAEEDQILAKVRAGEKVDHFETSRLTKSGKQVYVSITVSPIRDHLGRIVGASKIARDMTAQRAAQAQKDRFLAILAHELRNPLAPIRNAVALMRLGTLSEAQRNKALDMAERQTTHMARLLDDLLDISRLDTGKVELKRERFDLRTVAEQAVESLSASITARQHDLSTDFGKAPLWLDADPARILQILINLLSNAAKYTDPGGKLELELKRDGNDAVINMGDSGIGFTPEAKEGLFTLFGQAESAIARTDGGLGIGLALVREFVERHHGSVEAMSRGPGLGSCFTVRLPLHPSEIARPR